MNDILSMINGAIAQSKSGDEEWQIRNDQDAEWALTKIREEETDVKRLVNACQAQIDFYNGRIQQEQERLEQSTGYLKSLLLNYFGQVQHRKTKTQESYKLPSGTLKLKQQSPKYTQDNKVLLQWLKDRKMEEYVQVKESPKWGELKKTTKVVGNKVATQDGEIVEGVTVTEQAPIFTVEV